MFGLLQDTFNDFNKDECPRRAAALAYYAIFSLPALLVVVISIAGLIASREHVTERLGGYFQDTLGSAGARQVQTMLEQAGTPGRGLAGSVGGFAVLVLGASGVLLELQQALNAIWGVKVDPNQSGVRHFIVKRLVSLAMLLGIVFLLLVSLLVSWMLAEFSAVIEEWAPQWLSARVLWVTTLALTLVVITLLFAMLLKYVPDVQLAWSDVWSGAAITAVMFVAGKFALGLYLAWSDVTSTYGAAGSLALILLWVYYSALILFLGAEFTQVRARRRGRFIAPEPGAKPTD